MIQTLSGQGEATERPFLNVENLIHASYLALGLLLVAAVFLSMRFRDASQLRLSPEYGVLQDRERQLASIRKSANQGFASTRDYLIDNHPNSGEVYIEEIRRAKAGTTKAFLALSSWTAQQAALTQIDRDLAQYWTLLDQNRFTTVKEKQEFGYDFLQQRLLPARREVFDSIKVLEDRETAERAAILNRLARDRSFDLTAIFLIMGLTIAISLLLASGNQRFRRAAQSENRRKYEEMTSARDSLEQLSGRLLRIQEDERRKISRELHDGLGQTLTALRMEIHHVHFIATRNLDGGEERLIRARKLAEEAVQTVKDISLLLRPPLLDDLGLEPALAWLADQFTRRTDIQCLFHASNLQEHLPDDLKTCVFRVIQEALNNCEKHASPTCVEVVVEQNADMLSICVEDDGAGFTLNEKNTPARHAGLGILGMRERAVLLGGTLKIRSSPGKGTKLNMSLPVAKLGSALALMRLSPAAPASPASAALRS